MHLFLFMAIFALFIQTGRKNIAPRHVDFVEVSIYVDAMYIVHFLSEDNMTRSMNITTEK